MRELEHVISRAAIKAVSRGANRNHIVTLEASLLDLSGADPSPRRRRTRRPPRRRTACCLLRDAVDACQRQHVRLALQAHDGNWAAAARVLEVDPSNLHKLARRLGLKG